MNSSSQQHTTTAKGEQAIISILLSAEKLFLTHGYNGTSMRDIAEGAGYRSVAGIYNHFREKEDILVALLEARAPLDSLINMIELTKGATLAEFLPNLFNVATQFLNLNLGFIQLLLIDYFEFKGKHLTALNPLYEKLFHVLITRLEGLQDRPTDLSPLLLARLLQAQVVGYVFTQNLIPEAWDADDQQWKTQFLRFIAKGLSQRE